MMRRIFTLTFILSMSLCSYAETSDINAGKVYGDAGKLNVPVYRVAITADSPATAELAKRAFSLHGSYIQVPQSKAQFTFHFSESGNSARVSIRGGTLFEQTVTGSSPVNALMKACDLAVKKTVGTPGFFAGTIVFAYSKNGGDNGEICMSDMVFKNVRKLTNDNSVSMMPHFSPDGSKVMYTGYYRTSFMDLFELDLKANSRKVFASFKGSNTGGAFSPDGSKVAMILTSTGNAEVWTASANRGSFKRITRTPAVESSASFSPDGSKLVYASDTLGNPQLYICPVNGGKATRLITNLSRYCSEPVWSKANPNLIAFTAAQGGGFQLGVYDISTRQAKWVSRGASTSSPVWLNDGRHILCAKAVGKKRQLFIVDSETNSQKPLHTPSFGSLKEPDFVYLAR